MQITPAGNTSAAVVGQWVIAAYAGRPYAGRVINVLCRSGSKGVTTGQGCGMKYGYLPRTSFA